MAVELFNVFDRHIVRIGPGLDGGYDFIERYPSVKFGGEAAVVISRDEPGKAVERVAVIAERALKEALKLLSDKPLSQFSEDVQDA